MLQTAEWQIHQGRGEPSGSPLLFSLNQVNMHQEMA